MTLHEQTRDQAEWAAFLPIVPSALTQGARQFASLALANVEASGLFLNALTRTALGWQYEVVELAGSRLGEIHELGRKIAGARDASEVLKIEADYLRTMADDYVQCTRRLMDGSARLAEDLWEPVKERVKDAADAIERVHREEEWPHFPVAVSS